MASPKASSSTEIGSSPSPSLDEQLLMWKEEQYSVASQVVVVPDSEPGSEHVPKVPYRVIPTGGGMKNTLFGGVDVSFSNETEDDSHAVAVYVVTRGHDEIVYEDHERFDLKLPYVSSFLSFREIEPVERLIKKQMKERPDLTPQVILVDGNGIMHERRAGIACFVGVRTGIKTVGVGKTLYCHDGLKKDKVKRGVETRIKTFLSSTTSNKTLDSLLVLDCNAIDAGKSAKEIDATEQSIISTAGIDYGDLAARCTAFAIKMKGASGETWGAALLGHGGEGSSKHSPRGVRTGTKNPIFISVGHLVSLEEAIGYCAYLSRVRIPEPIRAADLRGRAIMRHVASAGKAEK